MEHSSASNPSIPLHLLLWILAASAISIAAPSPSPEGGAAGQLPLPGFSVSWLDDRNAFQAGDDATIVIRPYWGGGSPNETGPAAGDRYAANFSLAVDGRKGNSSRVSTVLSYAEGDPSRWNITFVPIWAGEFMAIVEEEHSGATDSSLHFIVSPGVLYPSACVASWMNSVNEFVAGTKANILILPRDAFGNNISSNTEGMDSSRFTLSATHEDGSAANLLNFTYMGWHGLWYLGIEFVPTTAGSLLLHVASVNQTLIGSPLSFQVHPGVLDFKMCQGKWKYETNVVQIFSRLEFFIYQKDQFLNLVPGFHQFDAGVVQKETNLSIPIADLSFQEMGQGIQLLSFVVTEPGNFMLRVFDVQQNWCISNTSYDYSVFVGYCDGLNSVVNGSGIIGSVAGRMSYFSVYLKDMFHNPSSVESRVLTVQILRENDTFSVRPIIFPQRNFYGGKMDSGNINFPKEPRGTTPGFHADRDDNPAAKSTAQTSTYNVAYVPEKSGNYDIWVFCGNIPLHGGQPYTMNVSPGMVDTSRSSVIEFASRTKRLVRNEVTVQLVDSFGNPITSQQAKLSFKMDPVNSSNILSWMFADKGDGLYIGHYLARDLGNYNICVSYGDVQLSPCPFEVNVYNREYFPEAQNDNISVWEDESVSFDAIGNDYFAGSQVQIINSSKPVHGSLIPHGQLFRYTPYKGFFGNDSFSYTISDVNENIDTGTVFIFVLCKPPQFVSLPVQLQVIEDVISPKFGGFPGFKIHHSDKMENISVTLRAQYGTIFLAPMPMQLFLSSGQEITLTKEDRTRKDLIIGGNVDIVNSALQLIQYLGNENFYGNDVISLYAMNKNGIQDAHVPVYIEPVNDPPFIHVPKTILLEKETTRDFNIFDKQMDSFELLIEDPDLHNFPGNKSHFEVTLSLELNDGILISNLPVHLIGTVELKIKNSHQWQHLQTFVTISNYFIIKGKGIRIRASVGDCNNAMKKLLYQGAGHGAILTISVNDMGNYGCYPDCAEGMSLPLYAEVAVNLIKKRPITSISAHLLGVAIIIELITTLLLGGMLLYFICKCTNVLYKKRKAKAATNAPLENSTKPRTNAPSSESLTYLMQKSSKFSHGSKLRQRSRGEYSSEGTSENKCLASSTANHQQDPSSSVAPFSIEREVK